MAAVAPAASKLTLLVRGVSRSAQPAASLYSAAGSAFLPRTAHFRPLGVGPQPRRMAAVAQQQFQDEPEHQHAPQEQQPQTQQQQLQQQQQQGGAIQAQRRSPLAPVMADLLGPWFPGDRSLHQMMRSVDRIFEDLMLGPGAGVRGAGWPSLARGPISALGQGLRAPWDVREEGGAYHLRFDLPGMSKEEVQVRVGNDNVLSISAEHSAEEEEGDVFTARVAQKYQTSLQLPDDVQRDGIGAEMRNGVLTVKVPKKEAAAKPEPIDVPIA